MFTAPERTFTRARRCANCRHYETGTKSEQEWNRHRKARQDDYLRTLPISRLADMEKAEWSAAEMNDARLQQLHMMDKAVASGAIGVCVKQASGGDFCHSEFLCDKWTGVDGHSVTTDGHDDKLGDELKDIADGRAEKK